MQKQELNSLDRPVATGIRWQIGSVVKKSKLKMIYKFKFKFGHNLKVRHKFEN
jgi:hypothetical protein